MSVKINKKVFGSNAKNEKRKKLEKLGFMRV